MESVFEIIGILLPILFIGAIAIFVIRRLKGKQERGTLGRKESTSAQVLLDSLIPLWMVFGTGIGLVLSLIFPFSLATGITFGAGLGFLGGYFAYESYSKREEEIQ